MNYSRRHRRPDSLFYRDQRKLGLSRRGRAARRAYILFALVLAIAMVAYMLLKR